MTVLDLACGEPLCKKRFEAEVSSDAPWPVRCPGCGRSLYPDEVLQSTALEDLDRFRGPLMRVAGARLEPVQKADLVPAPATFSKSAAGSILDEMVEQADRRKPAARKPPIAIIVAAVALVIALLSWWLTRN